jgi:hypothetical protein
LNNQNNWTRDLKNNGFHIQKSYFDKSFLLKVNDISNAIMKFERFFNFFGFGNQSLRNGNIFTANLLYKNDIFYDLLVNKGLLDMPKEFLGNFVLSEFKIVTSTRTENFSFWWHRDYPYQQGEDMGDVDLGILVPLIDFNKSVGPTVFIPKSHLLKNEPADLNTKLSYSKSEYLETSLGDIFIYDGKLFHSGSENYSNSNRNYYLYIL